MTRLARAAFRAATGLATALVAWQLGVRHGRGREATALHLTGRGGEWHDVLPSAD